MLRRLWLGVVLASWLGIGAPATALTYELIFSATWHPPPGSPPNPHFSPLIGGSHDGSFHLWAPGEEASAGIEAMAELGDPRLLRDEVRRGIRQGRALSLIESLGNDSPGGAVVTFEVDPAHPLVTVTTMVAPSPDWFVGVHDLPLFSEGAFLQEVVVPLFPYDAGTDSGPSFRSPNDDTQPQELIALLEDPGLFPVTPVGTFTFRAVPEPSSGLLAGLGLTLLAAARRRRSRPGPGPDR